MARIPDKPDEIFDKFSEDVQKAFGKELVSIILFGSGAKGEYVPGQSDLNFLIVLTQTGIMQLNKGLDLVEKWKKINVAVPLFLTKEYISSALDTFPIEFLGMKNYHKLVYGENVLAELNIDKRHLRHQIERELRGKLIYLRTGFMDNGNNREQLQQMLAASVSTFISIFAALLYFQGQVLPATKAKVFESTAAAFKLDKTVFSQLLNIKKNEWRGSKVQLQEIALNYIGEIKKLVKQVDKL